MEALTIVGLLVAFALGYGARRYRTYVFQNRGEARVSRVLRRRFRPPDYHLMDHLTLPLKNGTTQVDHVLISRFGVFVIETKEYTGWIFAGPQDPTWTQVLYRAKFRFQNPLRQNHLHVSKIRELLDFLPSDAVVPVVVFAGNAEFKTPIPDGVFTLESLLRYLDSRKAEVISTNRLQFCVGRLETTRLSISKATDVEHVEQLRRRYGERE